MKTHALFGLFISLFCVGQLSAQYAGQNPEPSYIFPIDGGRKVMVTVNPNKGKDVAIGYLTVTSTDSNGALNPQSDQAAVNQLVNQVSQLYAEIFNQNMGGSSSARPSAVPNSQQGSQPNQNAPTGCSQRRTPRWR